jgi:ubiquinone/menaquinone biosynthesis C-methylase UbiE
MKLVKSDTDIIEAFVPIEGRRFLDVGCGTGQLVSRLRKMGGRAVGIDTPTMLCKGKQKEPLSLVAAAGEYLPFSAGQFDCIIFMASLHHISPQKMILAIAEAQRVLKKSGSALIIEPVVRKGAYTEVTHLAEDETAELAAAYQAIEKSDLTGFSIERETLYYFERSFEDYRNLVDLFVDDETRRQSILKAAEQITRDLAESSHQSFADFRYPSICRVNLLKKKSPC